MSPSISVIVAIFNVESYLRRCVESLLSQTFDDIEVILVDDGSADTSGAICDDFASQDSRVVVVHQSNGGLSDARNAGLAVARGQYVSFLDGDDWAEPTMLGDLINAMTESSADVAVAGCIVDFEDDRGRVTGSERRVPGAQVLTPGAGRLQNDGDLLGLLGYAWNKCYQRDLIERHGLAFEKGLSLIEDVVFNAAVIAHTERVVVLPSTHVHYVQRPRQTLGVRHYEDFLSLRLRAVESLDAMIGHWGIAARDRAAMLAPLRQSAVRNLVRRTSQQQWGIRNQARHLRLVRSGLDRETRSRLIGHPHGRWLDRAYSACFVRASPALLLLGERARAIRGGLKGAAL